MIRMLKDDAIIYGDLPDRHRQHAISQRMIMFNYTAKSVADLLRSKQCTDCIDSRCSLDVD